MSQRGREGGRFRRQKTPLIFGKEKKREGGTQSRGGGRKSDGKPFMLERKGGDPELPFNEEERKLFGRNVRSRKRKRSVPEERGGEVLEEIKCQGGQ